MGTHDDARTNASSGDRLDRDSLDRERARTRERPSAGTRPRERRRSIAAHSHSHWHSNAPRGRAGVMVQCCPSCCYREDGTRKRKLKTWAIVLLSMLALGLGLGLGLAVKLYYFTPTRVIASVNLLGHNSDTFTAPC